VRKGDKGYIMFGRKKIIVPEWAMALGQKEYPPFMSAVEDYFKRYGNQYTIGNGSVYLGENNYEFGLANLVQLCAGIKPKDYPELIEHHFNSVIEARAFKENLSVDIFEKMKQYIGVRLYDKGYTGNIGEDIIIRRHLAGEVFAVLVYDFPHAIQTVPRNDTMMWGKTEDELYAIGLENIYNNYQLKAQEVCFDKDSVFVLETDHFFAPNILFELENCEEYTGIGGALIGIPTRSMALIYPIRDMKVVGALTLFFNSVPKFYAEGPGSLTQDIFWYYEGRYETLNYETGNEVQFTPSESFLALLNGGLEKA